MHILSNIPGSKCNETMKFDQLIEHFSSKIMQKMRQEDQFQLFFYFLFKYSFEVKVNVLGYNFNIFWQPSTWHTINTNCVKLQTIESVICSIWIFQKRILEQFFCNILCIIFQEKYFSCYILLADQISLPVFLYLVRYCIMCGF